MNKIKKMSHLLSSLFYASCLVYPILEFCGIFFDLDEMMAWAKPKDSVYQFANLSFTHHLVVFFIYSIPIFITVFICYQLGKLFQLYGRGFLFEKENIKLIKSIGIGMIVGELCQLLYRPVMSYVLTFYKPFGERSISVLIGTSNFATLLTGFVILTASLIIQEAQKLKTDVQFTV